MPFTIVRQDITRMEVDAIVNAANTDLAMGGGVCGAIFRAAGAQQMQEACDRVSPIRTGEAAITPGFALAAKYVIHAAGPVYHRLKAGQCRRYLYDAYKNALSLAVEKECTSIAFPLISSGIYGYPREEALKVATLAIADFLETNEMDIFLAVFDKAAFEVSRKLQGAVDSYIDEHYVESHRDQGRFLREAEEASAFNEEEENLPPPAVPHRRLPPAVSLPRSVAAPMSLPQAAAPLQAREKELSIPRSVAKKGLEDVIQNLDEPFNVTLLRLIDARGKTDAEVYKRANIDRRLFSKIRTGQGYMPSKRTAIALSIALELTLEETEDLLERAGYALSHSQKFDVIVEYFIVNRRYDIYEINEMLFAYDQPLLGG